MRRRWHDTLRSSWAGFTAVELFLVACAITLALVLTLPRVKERRIAQANEDLIAAISASDPVRVQEILNSWAITDHVDARGETPLLLASRLLVDDQSYPLDGTICDMRLKPLPAIPLREQVVTHLVAAGANVQVVSEGYGESTPLHYAVWNGNPSLVKKLLDAGADVNGYPGNVRITPLSLARQKCAVAVAKLLIAHGAVDDVFQPYHHRMTSAPWQSCTEVDDLIQESPAAQRDLVREMLANPLRERDYKTLDRLMQWLEDYSVPYRPIIGNLSMVEYAAQEGDLDLAHLLVQRDANFVSAGGVGDMPPLKPLNVAMNARQWDFAAWLVDHGARFNQSWPYAPLNLTGGNLGPDFEKVMLLGIEDQDAQEQLYRHRLAADAGELLVAAKLAAKVDPWYQRILFSACLNVANFEACDLLLAHGLDINSPGTNKYTPVIEALQYSDRGARLAFVLSHGGDPDAGETSLTALQYALYGKNSENQFNKIWLLVEAGVSLDSPPHARNTTLGSAMSTGQPNIVKFLLERGAEPFCGPPGQSPVEKAAKHPNPEFIRVFDEFFSRHPDRWFFEVTKSGVGVRESLAPEPPYDVEVPRRPD